MSFRSWMRPCKHLYRHPCKKPATISGFFVGALFMLIRSLFMYLAAVAGFASISVRAEVPEPPACEQLQVVVAPGPAWLAGETGEKLLGELARHSGLQLHKQETDDTQPGDFAFGVQDLWFPAGLEVLQQTAAHPLQPALWQEEYRLWFRAGELTGLQQLPQLSGLRGAYWPRQLEQGLLKALAVHVGLDNLRSQADPAAALQALLNGKVDFFLARRDEVLAAIKEPDTPEALESLAEPLLVKPYWLAISNNSACKDDAVVQQLEAALKMLTAR